MYKHIKCEKKRINIFKPQPHQTATVDYFLTSKYRGLLLYHALGSGKSCTSILASDALAFQKKKVHVFSPASLRKNFIDEYCKVCGKDPLILKNKYRFYSYNYSGIARLLPDDLDDSVIIIDEAHNVINGKRNNSPTLSDIYDLVNMSKNSKILLLSGTPIKKIYDIPLLINLLKPKTFNVNYDQIGAFDETILDAHLIDKQFDIYNTLQTLKVPKSNKEFLKFFEGVISYIAGADPKYYPKRIDNPIERVTMSEKQTKAFYSAVYKEVTSFRPDDNLKLRDPNKYAILMGLWHVANKKLSSRAASNFIYPPKIKIGNKYYGFNVKCDFMKETKSECPQKKEDLPTLPDKLLKDGGWIHKTIFNNGQLSQLYSPKMHKLLENIANNLDGKHMIYSVLKTRSGIYLLASILRMCGLSVLIYSGDIGSDAERARILNSFNSRRNLRGEEFQVILLTEAGGEGLTLKGVKGVHILESDKNEAKIQQVIGRAIRYKSHEDLPEEERYCNVWRYFSVPQDSIQRIAIDKLEATIHPDGTKLSEVWSINGIDANLYTQGLTKEKQKDIFLDLMKKASVI